MEFQYNQVIKSQNEEIMVTVPLNNDRMLNDEITWHNTKKSKITESSIQKVLYNHKITESWNPRKYRKKLSVIRTYRISIILSQNHNNISRQSRHTIKKSQ